MNLLRDTLRSAGLDKHKNIVIDTVHKFQGDEKDIILYSPVFPNSKLWNDKNLLNVAVSRAKSSFLVFGDKDAIFHAKNEDGTNLLKDLIVYIDNISKQKLEQEKFEKIHKFDTSYEKIFFDELKKAKIKFDFHSSIKEGQYELDFRLKLKGSDQYIMGLDLTQLPSFRIIVAGTIQKIC